MSTPSIIVPVKKPENILCIKEAGADILYVDYKDFLLNKRFNYAEFENIVGVSHSLEMPIYLYFGSNLPENELKDINNLINNLTDIKIDGILVNDFSIMDIIKKKDAKDIRYNVHLDSGLSIHNIASCKLFKTWEAQTISVTEEVHLKNVTKIRDYTGKIICIDINESIWFLHHAVNWDIKYLKITGTYEPIGKLATLIKTLKSLIFDIQSRRGTDNLKIEKIISLLDHSRPTKHYKTDHFTRKFKKYSGEDFEFEGSIKIFNWELKGEEIETQIIKPESLNNKKTKLRLRLTRLAHLDALEKYFKETGNNFVDIIEFGDILFPADLAKLPYSRIVYKVKQFCQKYNIKLYITTPRILIERDFNRYVKTLKYICNKAPRPEGLIINNLGLWRVVQNSKKLRDLKIEIGYGFDINNSRTIDFFKEISTISGVSINNSLEPDYIKEILKGIEAKTRSMVALGPSRMEASGLCPLNSEVVVMPRLQCKAFCQRQTYALVDPASNEMFPMVLDGFCRLHLVNSYIDDHLKNVGKYIEAGITDLVIDFTALSPEIIKPFLDRYFTSLVDPKNYQPIKKELIKYIPKVYTKT